MSGAAMESDAHAHPQRIRVGGAVKDIWPHRWGITPAQCRSLLAECRADPAWRRENTMREVVESYVKPRTKGSGLGLALLQNCAAPLEVNVMISHAWSENAEEFFATLARSVREEDILFICALSLYQCEDSAGPSIEQQLGCRAEESPFRRVLERIQVRREVGGWRSRCLRAVLRRAGRVCLMAAVCLFYYPIGAASCIPVGDACAVGTFVGMYHHDMVHIPNCWVPRWKFEYKPLDLAYRPFLPAAIAAAGCAVVLWLLKERSTAYRGLMIAVPNRECDLYSRLWCVYEIFVACKLGVPVELARTLASGGECSSMEATCSSAADMVRIHSEIKAWGQGLRRPRRGSKLDEGGAQRIDAAIRLVTHRAQQSMVMAMLRWFLPFAMLQVLMSVDHMSATPDMLFGASVCNGVVSIGAAGAVIIGLAFWVAKRAQGRPSIGSVLSVSAGLVLAGASLSLVGRGLAGLLRISEVDDFPLPFHHCFTATLVWGGISLGCLSLCTCCSSFRLRRRLLISAYVLLGGMVLFVLVGAAQLSADQLYPVAVWYFSFRAAPMIGLPSFFMFFIGRWGVQIERAGSHCSRSGAESPGSNSEAEEQSSSSIAESVGLRAANRTAEGQSGTLPP